MSSTLMYLAQNSYVGGGQIKYRYTGRACVLNKNNQNVNKTIIHLKCIKTFNLLLFYILSIECPGFNITKHIVA